MLGQVEKATAHEIVAWYFYLRPTMSNDELPIVKAIAGRYERMDSGTRDALRARVQREYSQ
jgi:hypothetical protein